MYRMGSMGTGIRFFREELCKYPEKDFVFSRIFLPEVYYTLRVLSVELCSSQNSPIFALGMCYGKPRTYSEVMSMLGARIAALRKTAGWSQMELAQRLRISPSAVGMYEQGRREPSADTLVALARVLGVSVDYLLTGTPEKQEASDLEDMLRDRITSADRRQDQRPCRSFSRQELAVLFAAMLMEP